MAIEFDCPHCRFHYKLKDELAGRTATCKNPQCRKKITIPQPVTIPDDVPQADLEAAALAALSDEPKAEASPQERVIPVECQYCNHKWTEPLTRAGKNTLCPNPECKQRIKIPEAKADEILDWRQTRTKGPSLAKQNFEKLEGVQDAAEAKQLSSQTIREKVLEEEVEPRPLKQKIFLVLLGLFLVGSVTGGIYYFVKSRSEKQDDRLMVEAQEELNNNISAFQPGEAPLFQAVMHIAGGEYALRQNDPQKLKDAIEQFAKAREALRKASATPERNALCEELAVASLVLGGTDEQAKEELRIRWLPDPNLKTRPNQRVFTVLEELRQTLALLLPTEFDYRVLVARRLTRELIAKGQPDLVVQLIPGGLFGQTEQDEAKAVVALELYRADKKDHARALAEQLKARGAELVKATPFPVSAQALFAVLGTPGAPVLVKEPSGTGQVQDAARFAYTAKLLLEDRRDEAIALAKRSGPWEGQVKSLVLCAEWSPDPGPALDAALPICTSNRGKKELVYPLLRLAQRAAEVGKPDVAKQFAEMVPDEGLREWAKGEVVRLRFPPDSTEKADPAWVDLPSDPKKWRAGHAWGRMWVARQNTRASGDRGAEVKALAEWPGAAAPFGKAGVALGLQDRAK